MKLSRNLALNLGVSLLAPLFFFLVLEGVLTLVGIEPLALSEDPYVGYSASQPLFLQQKDPYGSDLMVTNPVKLEHFNRQSFSLKKSPGTYRIFSVGGSTAYGHPWRDPVSFSGWLRELLPAADSSKKWEVINCGGISYASYREALLIAEISHYHPDLILVYSGHNEFLEERTYRKTAGLLALVRNLNSILDKTRTFSAFKLAFRKMGLTEAKKNQSTNLNGGGSTAKPASTQDKLAGEVDDVLAKTIGPTSYTRNDTLHEEVVEHYRNSLERMAKLAHSVGAEIIFITTPTNEKDCSPFKSEPKAGLTSEEKIRITNLIHKSDSSRVFHKPDELTYLDSAIKIDDRNASLYYAAGQAAMGAKKFTLAKIYFQKAIDEDICPLRALSSMRKAVIETAQKQHAPLLDFATLLENKTERISGHRILGEPEFVDHVHLSIENYQLLALSILEKMDTLGLVKKNKNWGDSSIALITQKVMSQMGSRELGEGLHNLAKVINWAGKHEDAARIAERALQVDSSGLEAIWSSLFVGAARERSGLEAEAILHYERAVRLDSLNTLSRHYLADALVRNQQIAEAEKEYSTILYYDPQDEEARNQLQKIKASENKSSQAVALFEAGKLAQSKKNIPEAISLYARALSIDPSLQEARNRLSQCLGGFGGK